MQSMPQIERLSVLLVLLLSLALISGCGDANPAATFDPESAEGHPSDWLPSLHAAKAASSLDSCSECHGDSFGGGISGVACTSCHLGSPTDVHPLNWGNFTYAYHEGFVRANGTSSCANAACHGPEPELAGVEGSGPPCSSCHLGDEIVMGVKVFNIHPPAWDADFTLHGDFVQSQGTSTCENITCHGAALEGVLGSGVSCSLCH